MLVYDSLFYSHLDLAYQYWKKLVYPGDLVIDATCGKGRDTLKLSQLAIHSDRGEVYACDIQTQAIQWTQHYLTRHLSPQQVLRIHFVLGCHSQFPSQIQPNTVKLIVYNLGYLPGGDKTRTTKTESSLQSLRQAQELVMPGGAISLTCYPGHTEGALEENAILAYVKNLPSSQWSCCYHQWLNRCRAPSLLLLQKKNRVLT